MENIRTAPSDKLADRTGKKT